ncbi:MAG TPA: glycerophosphodiester phosphodiesterase family protein [Kofleriaceae bacterium]|nr:glycerophosphodiester phosphodiesterase family protein [Kofleriaceae bacterium]
MIVGHRGVPTLHQENTVAGFRRAVELGLEAIELDVRLTRDQRAVVFHDASTLRLTGVRRAIAELSWDEISKLRVQPMLSVRGRAVRYERAEPIALLAEVLAEVGGAVAINIELKPRFFGDRVAEVVAADIAAAGAGARVMVSSFDPRKLREAGRADPALALGFCWNHSVFGGGRRLVDRLAAGGEVRAVGADLPLLHEASVRRMRAAGLAVGAHVAFPLGAAPTPRAEVERLLALGLDWIESDDPARLQQIV